MRVSAILVAAVAVLFLRVPLCAGQDVPDVGADDRVRITLEDDQQFTGTLMAQESRSLIVLVQGAGRQTFELGAIQRLELSHGMKREGNVWRGAGIGALIGAAGGGLFVLLSGVQSDAGGGANAAAAIAIGAGAGAIAGAIIGSGPEREDWREVPLESLQLGVGPVGNGKWGLVASFVF